MVTTNETIDRLRYFTEQKGWSLYRLAKECDMPYSSLNNIFQRNNEPTIPTLRTICSGLGISLAEFFADEPAPIRIDYTLEERNLVLEYRTLSRRNKQLLKVYAAGLGQKLPDLSDTTD